jgi:hypothetical protein
VDWQPERAGPDTEGHQSRLCFEQLPDPERQCQALAEFNAVVICSVSLSWGRNFLLSKVYIIYDLLN